MMVVKTLPASVRSSVDDDDGRAVPYRFTVEQYHEMIARGILREGEPYELIHGRIVRKDRSTAGEDPVTIGDHHIWAVTKLGKVGRRLERLGCYMRTQQPVLLPPFDEPEPDGAIAVGTEDDYLDRKPGAGDVLCVIEVSDSSLRYDRTVKQQIYADSGIPVYVIVNLPEQAVEVYTQPLAGTGRYGQGVTLTGGQKVHFPAPGGKELVVPARQLLPP